MKGLWIALAAVLPALGSCLEPFTPEPVFENVYAAVTIDLTGSYGKQSITLTVKNVDRKPQSEYYYGVDSSIVDKLSMVEGRNLGNHQILKIHDTGMEHDRSGLHFYKVDLDKPLGPGEEANLIIAQAVLDQMQPLPEYGSQSDPQFLVFRGSRHFVSPYRTRTAETKVNTLGAPYNDLDEDEDRPQANGPVYQYGPYTELSPFAVKPLNIRYENPLPLIKATKLDRDIWISHWAQSMSVEETFWVKHIGTKLRDGFSRLDYRRGLSSFNLNYAAIKELVFGLKPDAREVYFTDLVGNVSTSHFRTESQGSMLSIRPRYPVFGGWNYNFTVGWTYDLNNFVKSIGDDRYLLKVPLLESPKDISYDEVTVRIILPEGASDIEVMSPMDVRPAMATTYSFLDTVGRPTASLHYDKLFDGHARAELYVEYTYTSAAGLQKPLSVAAAFFAVFSAVLALNKINIGISASSKTQ